MTFDRDKEGNIIWNKKSNAFYREITEKIYNAFPNGIPIKEKNK